MNACGPQRTLAHTLLHSMDRTTPGGIDRRMLSRGRPPWLLLIAWTVLGVLFFIGALAWITR